MKLRNTVKCAVGVLLFGCSSAARLSLGDEFRLPTPKGQAAACPCDDESLCDVLTAWPTSELFGFGDANADEGLGFPWDTITTVAWADTSILCEAHANGVRLVAATTPPLTDNQTEIDEYIAATVQSVQENFFDGVTFDWESSVTGYDDPKNTWYVNVINQTTTALKALNSGYQTSVCAAWSPNGIDSRWYDYVALSEVSDWLYVMMYDTRSQIYDRCTASANAPWSTMRRGITEYLTLGIPAAKLVLGLPWYGYRYPCIGDGVSTDVDTCNIAQVPWQGVNCSDAAGSEVSYGSIRQLINDGKNATPVRRDPYLNAPYFNLVDEDTGGVVQYWYDDPTSLAPMYAWAKDQGLKGTGPYRFDQLDPAGNPDETAAMWAALAEFLA